MTEIKLPLTMDAVEELCKVAQKEKATISIRIYGDDNTDIDIEPFAEKPSVHIDTTMYP